MRWSHRVDRPAGAAASEDAVAGEDVVVGEGVVGEDAVPVRDVVPAGGAVLPGAVPPAAAPGRPGHASRPRQGSRSLAGHPGYGPGVGAAPLMRASAQSAAQLAATTWRPAGVSSTPVRRRSNKVTPNVRDNEVICVLTVLTL
nr:hypothetical protein [uncultured Cellulomonas sp.]